jgi:hypothetical protein
MLDAMERSRTWESLSVKADLHDVKDESHTLEYGIAAKFCDMESVHTYEGTYDINALVCGRAITGISAIKPPKKKKTRSKL